MKLHFVLIGSDSKYPQLNPLTTNQEQDLVDWLLALHSDLSSQYGAF